MARALDRSDPRRAGAEAHRAAREMDRLAEARDAIARKLGDLERTLASRRAPEAAETARSDQSSSDPASGTATEAAGAMAQGQRSGETTRPGERGGGDMGGMGEATGRRVAGEATRLEVARRPEELMLLSERKQDELVDQPSRAAEARTSFDPVRATRYAPPDPLNRQTVPAAARPLVKRYFQTLGPRSRHDR
jgi:hypothetical protein